MFVVKGLRAGVNGKEILREVNLTVKPKEVHAIMGPNGSGKTTLAMSLMGHPGYNLQFSVSNSQISISGKDISNLLPEERAKAGLFVSFQNPIEITGVSLLAFLRTARKAMYPSENIPLSQFKKEIKDALISVGLNEEFMHRSVNEGFSGGERKRCEIVQLLVLRPKFAILDEIDSGLDVDSLKVIAKAIMRQVEEYNTGIILITHYQRILHFIRPHSVHVLINGRIERSGGMKLVRLIEKEGYAAI
jgi:Fe-S cluster assembly ATP-binding protein